MSNQPNHPNRWQIVGGILGGLATLITAVASVVTLLDKDEPPPSPPPTPEKPSGTDSSQMDGVWDVRSTATQKISQDGFIDDYNSFADYVIKIKSVGKIITGEIVGARGPSNPCSEATINGRVDGSNVEYTLQHHGSCCSGEKAKFTGSLSEEGNSLIGKYEPVDIPTSSCSMWWADVVGKKRSQNQ